MAVTEYGKDYLEAVNAWHLELAIVEEVVSHLLGQVDGPDWVTSAGHVACLRLRDLVEGFPFPCAVRDVAQRADTVEACQQ